MVLSGIRDSSGLHASSSGLWYGRKFGGGDGWLYLSRVLWTLLRYLELDISHSLLRRDIYFYSYPPNLDAQHLMVAIKATVEPEIKSNN